MKIPKKVLLTPQLSKDAQFQRLKPNFQLKSHKLYKNTTKSLTRRSKGTSRTSQTRLMLSLNLILTSSKDLKNKSRSSPLRLSHIQVGMELGLKTQGPRRPLSFSSNWSCTRSFRTLILLKEHLSG
jgi:hypothetical protein